MKRGKTNLILCSLILIAAGLAEIYCFLEFRKDILTILGTSVIVLVAAFMTLDSFLSMFYGGESSGAKSDEFRVIQRHLAEIEKVQKATFVILKKNAVKEQEVIRKVAMQIEQQREIMVKTGKLIAKYDRENSLRLEELLRKIAERPDFDDTGLLLSLGTTNQSLEKLTTDFEKLKNSLEDGNFAALVKESVVQTGDNVVEEIAEQEAAAEQESIEIEEAVERMPMEQEAISEPEPAPEIDTSDPNKMMSPDDIAALLASMGGEEAPAEEPVIEKTIPEPEPAPEIDTSDPNKMMSPDDIAALLASMGGEEAPAEEPVIEEAISEPEPAPEIDTSDPNKMMSPDDIAALLASMGGEEAPAEEPAVEEAIPEPEPVPEIDTSDPNKMMSPDDIAALLASMGQ